MIASGLDTVDTSVLLEYLKKYFIQNQVDKIVIGFPVDLRGNVSEVEGDILRFIEEFQNIFPEIGVERFDERFTSRIASYFISQSGKNKKQRQEKSLIDKVSATLILQQYLEKKI